VCVLSISALVLVLAASFFFSLPLWIVLALFVVSGVSGQVAMNFRCPRCDKRFFLHGGLVWDVRWVFLKRCANCGASIGLLEQGRHEQSG